MATIGNGNAFTIAEPIVSVRIGGDLRGDVACKKVVESFGITPTRADFEIARATFESDYSRFLEGEVVVYARQEGRFGGGSGLPVFRGFLDMQDATLSEDQSSISLSGYSILSKLSKVTVGLLNSQGTVTFPKFVPGTIDTPTGWNVWRILQYLFDQDNLADEWRALVGLGNTSVLRKRGTDYPAHGVTFTGQTYLEALRYLAEIAGNIMFRERFTNAKTLLDVVEIGDPYGQARIISIPTSNAGPEQGRVTVRTVERDDVSGVRNRIVGFGQPVKYMLTASTQNGGLEPAWTDATAYSETEGFTADETAVFANPDIVNPDKKEEGTFDPERADIFRKFRLSQVIRQHTALESNIWRNAQGQRIQIQVFIQKPIFTRIHETPAVGEVLDESVAATDEWTLVRGAKILDDGYVLLPEAALVLYRTVLREGDTGRYYESVFARSHVFVTITVQRPETQRMFFDTGISGRIGYGGLSNYGFAEVFVNENLALEKVGVTTDDGFLDADGNAYEYGAIWYDELSDEWTVMDAGEQGIVTNDSAFLIQLCQALKRERDGRVTEGEVVFPYHNGSMSIGDSIILNSGRGRNRRLQINTIVRNLYDENTGASTAIVATNRVPTKVKASTAKPNPTRRDAKGFIGSGTGSDSGRTFMGQALTSVGPAHGAGERELANAQTYGNLLRAGTSPGPPAGIAHPAITPGRTPARIAADPRAPQGGSVNRNLLAGRQGSNNPLAGGPSRAQADAAMFNAPGQRGLLPSEQGRLQGPQQAPAPARSRPVDARAPSAASVNENLRTGRKADNNPLMRPPKRIAGRLPGEADPNIAPLGGTEGPVVDPFPEAGR